MSHSLGSIKDYYYDTFVPAYADAVASLGDKPIQLLIEQENTLAHLMASLDEDMSGENLKKAVAHLERATLDCYKIIWVVYKEKIEYFIRVDRTNFALAFNKEESEVLEKIQKIDSLAKEARRLESINIGKNNSLALKKYMEVVELEKSLLDSADIKKFSSYNRFKLSYILKDQVIGIIVGILTGLLTSYLWERFF